MSNLRLLAGLSDGMDAHYSTYSIDNSTIAYDSTKARGAATTMLDKAVSLSAAKTVQLASDGEAVIGKLIKVEADNFATIQDRGYMEFPGGSGATLTRGKKIVGALGAASAKGYIREVATGTAAELGLQNGEIIDSGTASATLVKY